MLISQSCPECGSEGLLAFKNIYAHAAPMHVGTKYD